MERYIAILHPYAYQTWVTRKRIAVFIAVVVMALLLILVLHEYLEVHGLFMLIVGTSTIIIFFFTAFAYTRIYLVVKNLSSSLSRPHDAGVIKTSRKKRLLKQIKLAKSCFIGVLSYGTLFLFPAVIAIAVYSRRENIELQGGVIWCINSGILNASLNSITYFWTNT